jgi:regulator of cell morphogenesis and NO signaling
MTIVEDTQDMMNMTVADVALTFPQALEILNRYNLDYCCGGKKPFVEVCKKAGLDADLIWQELMLLRANSSADSRMRFDTWNAPLLIDFILQHHHNYVRESIPVIQELLNKICQVHGEDSPYLLSVWKNFEKLADELLDHLPKEEQILFPAIKRIFDQQKSHDAVSFALEVPITVMEMEHENAGVLIKSIRSLTDNYNPPAHACTTFRMAYNMLDQFDKDLMQHIHLENNILFPKVKLAQEQFLSKH